MPLMFLLVTCALQDADATRKSAVNRWSDEIEREVGQPPQRVLPFVEGHPYTRQAILDAAAFAGMNADLLAGMLFADFAVENAPKGALDGQGEEYQIDSFLTIGMDAFTASAARLKRLGYLPSTFEFRAREETWQNEKGMELRAAYFRNLRDATLWIRGPGEGTP